MNHKQASDLLVAFEAGELESSTTESVAAHVASCPACRSWLETVELLKDGLGGATRRPADSHPSSQRLADWIVHRDDLDAEEGRQVARHLERCDSCSTIASALVEGLGAAHEVVRPAPRRTRRAVVTALAIAASLLTMLLSVRLVTRLRDQPIGGAIGAPSPAPTQELAGNQIVESATPLALQSLRVADRSSVTFRAPGRVTLNGPFKVGSGTSVTFQVLGSQQGDPPHPAADPR